MAVYYNGKVISTVKYVFSLHGHMSGQDKKARLWGLQSGKQWEQFRHVEQHDHESVCSALCGGQLGTP